MLFSPGLPGRDTLFCLGSSLALAKRIKEKSWRCIPAHHFGGARIAKEKWVRLVARNFPFIDTVVSGEGEGVILNLVHERLTGDKPKKYIHGNPIQNMDQFAVPDFSDYFKAVKGDPGINQVRLVAEASRGCWWEAISHCTFCGFNGTAMPYRSKTPQRFVDELKLLRSMYKINTFLLTDNIS